MKPWPVCPYTGCKKEVRPGQAVVCLLELTEDALFRNVPAHAECHFEDLAERIAARIGARTDEGLVAEIAARIAQQVG